MGSVGRFAPSPTGELHFGSLVAAVGSYLESRSRGGKWLLRIEDLDPDRQLPLATDAILFSLEAHGFEWDEKPLFQSERIEQYHEALQTLQARGAVFACSCSRQRVRAQAERLGLAPGIYSGRCLGRSISPKGAALRVAVPEGVFEFVDGRLGVCRYDYRREVGPFVVRRRDGVFAYQLAVVVDDALSGVDQVVRGADLLSSTPMQGCLQRYLGFSPPEYLHLPLVFNHQGQKLSKQTGAEPLDNTQAAANLTQALRFLGQRPPESLAQERIESVWQWALKNYRRDRIPV